MLSEQVRTSLSVQRCSASVISRRLRIDHVPTAVNETDDGRPHLALAVGADDGGGSDAIDFEDWVANESMFGRPAAGEREAERAAVLVVGLECSVELDGGG